MNSLTHFISIRYFADLHYNLGEILSDTGKKQDAITEYEIATQINPQHAYAQKNLGQLLADMGHISQAIEHFKLALKARPDWSPELNSVIGNSFEKLGDIQEAVDYFQQAIQARPSFAMPYNNLAWIYATSNDAKFRDPKRAIVLADRAAELEPRLPGLYNTLGIANYRR